MRCPIYKHFGARIYLASHSGYSLQHFNFFQLDHNALKGILNSLAKSARINQVGLVLCYCHNLYYCHQLNTKKGGWEKEVTDL